MQLPPPHAAIFEIAGMKFKTADRLHWCSMGIILECYCRFWVSYAETATVSLMLIQQEGLVISPGSWMTPTHHHNDDQIRSDSYFPELSVLSQNLVHRPQGGATPLSVLFRVASAAQLTFIIAFCRLMIGTVSIATENNWPLMRVQQNHLIIPMISMLLVILNIKL